MSASSYLEGGLSMFIYSTIYIYLKQCHNYFTIIGLAKKNTVNVSIKVFLKEFTLSKRLSK